MKILEELPKEPWTAQIECLYCRAKLEIEESDVHLRYGAAAITCPVCRRDFSIENLYGQDVKVPAHVYNRLIDDIGKELKEDKEKSKKFHAKLQMEPVLDENSYKSMSRWLRFWRNL